MAFAPPDFDEMIDRRGTHSMKWDMMGARYGVTAPDAISMWVADMDFRPPSSVQRAVERMAAHGLYGYFGNDAPYLGSIRWWMQTRHGWAVDPAAIFTAHGLVNGTALCVQTWTQPGDGVVVFTPVYHAFAMVIRNAGRRVIELPLVERDGRMTMDFPASLPDRTRMVILCSPHNPGGQVWTQAELRGVADFAKAHDLILVADEIHHDLVMPGQRHIPMPLAAPDVLDRLVMLTATTKTFNIAGAHIGNVIIPAPALRARFRPQMLALGISPNSFGMAMATAAYSPEGAAWVDALLPYLDGNRRVFETGVGAIPGVRLRALQATYLEWVDFSGMGMDDAALRQRIEGQARIVANHGATFGQGGAGHMRFNIATPRARVAEAVERLHAAFADLQ